MKKILNLIFMALVVGAFLILFVQGDGHRSRIEEIELKAGTIENRVSLAERKLTWRDEDIATIKKRIKWKYGRK